VLSGLCGAAGLMYFHLKQLPFLLVFLQITFPIVVYFIFLLLLVDSATVHAVSRRPITADA
jgi:hypothetical protein